MLPWISAGHTRRCRDVHAPTHSSLPRRACPVHHMRSVRGYHSASPSDQHTSMLAAAPCYKRTRASLARAADGRLASTRSTAPHTRMLAAAAACMTLGAHASPPSRSSQWRRTAPPTTHAPAGEGAAEAWGVWVKGGVASAVIPVSQHCEGPVYGLGFVAVAASPACRCHDSQPPESVPPRHLQLCLTRTATVA